MAQSSAEPMAYEELTSLYRKERSSNSLAELRHDFYPSLAEMISRTQREYEKALSTDPDSIVCEGLNQRRKKMMDISQRIIDDRMVKIASMALKGGVGYGDSFERLTSEERALYQKILESFRSHRSVLPQLRRREFRIAELPAEPEPPAVPVDEPPPVVESVMDPVEEVPLDVEEGYREHVEPVELMEDEEKDNLVVRILEDLPTFSGPYRDYTLSKEDVVLMPRTLAEALINRQAAVEVRPRL